MRKTIAMASLFFLSAMILQSNLSCRKYEEGGWRYNAMKHLQGQGTAQRMEEYTVNGVDSMGYLKDSVFRCSLPFSLGFDDKHSSSPRELIHPIKKSIFAGTTLKVAGA